MLHRFHNHRDSNIKRDSRALLYCSLEVLKITGLVEVVVFDFNAREYWPLFGRTAIDHH